MRVFVNDKSIRIFTGAKAVDAIHAYYKSRHTTAPEPLPLIKDRYGNLIEPDGSLSPDNHLFIVEPANTSNYE